MLGVIALSGVILAVFPRVTALMGYAIVGTQANRFLILFLSLVCACQYMAEFSSWVELSSISITVHSIFSEKSMAIQELVSYTAFAGKGGAWWVLKNENGETLMIDRSLKLDDCFEELLSSLENEDKGDEDIVPLNLHD